MRDASQPDHILVTGAAGFPGSTLAEHLFASGHKVTAVDSFDHCYDPAMKRAAIAGALRSPRYQLIELVRTLGDILEITPRIHHLPDQPGELPATWAVISKAWELLGYSPTTSLGGGLARLSAGFATTAGIFSSAAAMSDPVVSLPAQGKTGAWGSAGRDPIET